MRGSGRVSVVNEAERHSPSAVLLVEPISNHVEGAGYELRAALA